MRTCVFVYVQSHVFKHFMITRLQDPVQIVAIMRRQTQYTKYP